MGPRGKRRTLVKRDSMGLQFSHGEMLESNKLWDLDTRLGILHFNTRHPTWVLCDRSDRKIRQLQETIAIQALTVEMMPEDWQETARLMADVVIDHLVMVYHGSSSFNFRKHAPKAEE